MYSYNTVRLTMVSLCTSYPENVELKKDISIDTNEDGAVDVLGWGGEKEEKELGTGEGGGRREVVYQTNRGPETWMGFASELIVV